MFRIRSASSKIIRPQVNPTRLCCSTKHFFKFDVLTSYVILPKAFVENASRSVKSVNLEAGEVLREANQFPLPLCEGGKWQFTLKK